MTSVIDRTKKQEEEEEEKGEVVKTGVAPQNVKVKHTKHMIYLPKELYRREKKKIQNLYNIVFLF